MVLTAAIGNLPGALEIVGSDGAIGPYVAVTGDFARVVEVVKHAKLQRELVLVRSNVGAVHCQAFVAIANGLAVLLEISEDLIVGAVFLDDVDDMLDGRFAAGEGYLLLRRLHSICRQRVFREAVQLALCDACVHHRERAVEERCYISEVALLTGLIFCGFRAALLEVVGAGAGSLPAGDEDFAA